MIASSIFPQPDFHSDWEPLLRQLTPVEQIGDLRFKREDTFAPLGYGGINGGKLRQCIHLIGEAKRAGARGVVTGASLLSPQLSAAAAVAAYYGLPCRIVIAGRPETVLRHSNIQVAAGLGAEFTFSKVGYNPALQSKVRELKAGPLKDWYLLEYGLGAPSDGTPQATERFHAMVGHQVANLPSETETIIIPTGSGNSTASILYGLALNPPPSLKKVLLFGIGPNRLNFLRERLALLEETIGQEVLGLYGANFRDTPALEAGWRTTLNPGWRWELEMHDLQKLGWAEYGAEMKADYHGLQFHPRYEGKVWRFLEKEPEFARLFNPTTVFWNVGSKQSLDAMPMIPRVETVKVAP